jgi:hypothetical protein
VRGRALVVGMVAVAAGMAGAVLPLAAPAAAAAGTLRDDFDGDGHRDLAIGTPGAESVTVTFGGAGGIGTRAVTLTQATRGVPGTPEEGDAFGESVTSADVDADGYADLIVGAPGERVEGREGTGSVTVLWGGADGFTRGGLALGAPSAADRGFGEAAAFTDLDGDGTGNLAVISENRWWWYADGVPRTALAPEVDFLPAGVRLEGMEAGHFTSPDGWTYVLYGERADGAAWTAYLEGGPGDLGHHWGVLAEGDDPAATRTAAATGDVDGDGYHDLVTGAPGHGSGAVTVRYGAPGGFTAPVTWTQATAGVPGTDEAGDAFGAAVAVGDVTGDGRAEIAVGVPGEQVGAVPGTGAVTLLAVRPGGPAGSAWHQEDAGVPGVAEDGDRFGSAVRLKDVTGDGRADLAAAASGEDIGTDADAGAVWVLRGTSSGLTTDGVRSFNGADFGTGGPGRGFGTVLF